MWLIRGLIGSELGSFLSITAVDAIESKIFQNRQPTRTQRASTHQYRCARAAGLAQLRTSELEHAIWAPSRARRPSRQSTARCRRWKGPWRGFP